MTEVKKIKVWDIAVRIFHWSLVVFFVIAYITGEEESELHDFAGYVILGLIVFRVLWGFIGSHYARFLNFIYSPQTTINYARSIVEGKPKHYLGHNPLGAWMVITLLVTLGLTIWSGLELEALEGHGPLAMQVNIVESVFADDDESDENEHESEHEGDEFWEDIHEFFANITLMLVFLHIAGVLFSSYVHRENLIKAMITGYKQNKSD